MSYIKMNNASQNDGFKINNLLNQSAESEILESDIIFKNDPVFSIKVYSILFMISTTCNLNMLYYLIKRRLKYRMDLMLIHLGLADLLVTFSLMPTVIAWIYKMQWILPIFCLKLLTFEGFGFGFGFYLQGFVLICISIERYTDTLKPPKIKNQTRIMLGVAWLCAIICSLLQVYLYHLEEKPKHSLECLFPSSRNVLLMLIYNGFNFCTMYAFPIVCIIYFYARIFRAIKTQKDVLSVAEKHALQLSIAIILAFIIFRTAYIIISLWYELSLAYKSLFIFGFSNAYTNPIICAIFNILNYYKPQNYKSESDLKANTNTNCGDLLELGSLQSSQQIGAIVELDNYQGQN